MTLPKDHMSNVMKQKLKEIAMGDKAQVQCDGPQVVVAPVPGGDPSQPQLQIGWQLTIWLEHNRLIGQDPIGVTVPVGGVLPPAAIFEQGVVFLLDEGRRIREKANHPELDDQPEPDQDIPAALRGKAIRLPG